MRTTKRASLLVLLGLALTCLCGLTRPPAATPETRIQFLGTGAAWPVPRLACSCATCGAARGPSPKSRRLRSSLKIGTGPYLLVDIGPDVYRQLVDLPDPRPAAVLLTHTHPDHAGGVSDLFPLVRKQPLPLLTAPAVWDELVAGCRYAKASFRFQDATAPVRVGPYTVTTMRLEHGTHAVGFRVACGARAMAYVTDVERVPDASLPALANLDLMVLDGTNIGGGGAADGHISPAAIRALIAATRPKRVLFTHVGHAVPPHETLAANVRREYPGADVAHDGLETEF